MYVYVCVCVFIYLWMLNFYCMYLCLFMLMGISVLNFPKRDEESKVNLSHQISEAPNSSNVSVIAFPCEGNPLQIGKGVHTTQWELYDYEVQFLKCKSNHTLWLTKRILDQVFWSEGSSVLMSFWELVDFFHRGREIEALKTALSEAVSKFVRILAMKGYLNVYFQNIDL